MMKQAIIALKMILLMTLLTGVVYTIAVTQISHLLFREKANGSLVYRNGQIIGSKLMGQDFSDAGYFWPRPSSTGYNPYPSGGSNLGPTSDKLKKLVIERAMKFSRDNLLSSNTPVPGEMLFSSASGLDPYISPEAALLQVERIARVRGFSATKKEDLCSKIRLVTTYPQFLILGEPRVNVFLLNLELDSMR